MKRELQEQLLKLYASREPLYRMQVYTTYLLDSLAHRVYEDEKGDIVYDSAIFDARALVEVDYAHVLVVKIEPDWEGIKCP